MSEDSASGGGGLGGLVGAVAGAVRSAATAVAGAVAERAGHTTGQDGAPAQTLTIARSADEVLVALRDPAVLSRLLGDAGAVTALGDDRYAWALQAPGGERTWESRLVERPGGLAFVDAAGGDDAGAGAGAAAGTPAVSSVEVSTRSAPQQLGTEVRLALALPVPDLAAGALAFTVLYRLRALLQTGEIPTLGHQPSARRSPR